MDKKISALDLVTVLDTGDVLPIVNQATTKKVTVAKLIDGLATTVYVDTKDALKVDKVTGKGLSTEDYTTAEKSKLAGITGTNTGDQNLQQVTDKGNFTTNSIYIQSTIDYGLIAEVVGTNPAVYADNASSGNGVEGNANTGIGVYAYSQLGVGLRAESVSGKGIQVFGNGSGTPSVEVNLGNTNKGLVINSGTSSTGNFIELDKNGVDKLVVNQQGELTATKLIKEGGTSSQLLAANGDTITAGTNITISGGTISSTGGSGGSSSVSFYLNGSIASNVAGYQQIGTTAVIGTGTDFSLVGNGTIAQFLTDVGSPNRLEIPSGAWNFELWLQSSINNLGTNVHIELYKYDGAFTLIATGVSNPISLQTNTTTNLYVTNIAIPQTTLLATDRLAVRVIATNAVGLHNVTLHTEDSNLCEVITNFVSGVTAINGITQPSQTLATGTTGTDFAVVSSGSTHTFNLPSASAIARGVVTTGVQTIAGDKTFTGTTAGITKSMVGLSNVDNTSDVNKPISTATQTALNLKQNTITLTTNGTSGASTLIGDTLNIPQYDTPSLSAFTILANNTNASAVATEQVYKDVAEQSFSNNNIVWTATTAPSGTTNHTYKWSQIGKLVTLRVNLSYTGAGAQATIVSIPFDNMSDLPIPAIVTGFTTNGDVIGYGSGQMQNVKTNAVYTTTGAATSSIRKNTTGTGTVPYDLLIIRNTNNPLYAWATIQYYTT